MPARTPMGWRGRSSLVLSAYLYLEMPMRPELRSFSSLGPPDFENHPVWIRVRSFDFKAPWYDDADEETFRLWDGVLPFAKPRGMVLVAAKLKFKDGSV